MHSSVSIPHRFNSHHLHLCKIFYYHNSFNPSQVQFTLEGRLEDIVKLLSFNPSQVQFTHIKAYLEIFEKLKFQSLTGSIHTTKILSYNRYVVFVSIPHRFNSHMLGCLRRSLKRRSFNPSQVQFTQDFSESWEQKFVLFQSLTGSIHTKEKEVIKKKVEMFQSLTGSIHTSCCYCLWSFLLLVSIPHRFNSHFSQSELFMLKKRSFNPSQVQFTLNFQVFKMIKNFCFNPSQVQFTLSWG